MDLAGLAALQSPAGRDALAAAAELAPDEASFLACFNRLSRRFPAALARAAVEAALLRRKARAKFRRADAMLFEREALEQSSNEAVARHRAGRFAGLSPRADLGCGLGGDAIALAEGAELLAVDLDPLRLALCRHNLAAYGVPARLAQADVLTVDLGGVRAAFADPDRRVAGRRQVSAAACRPALDELRVRLPVGLPLGVKLAPAVPWAELSRHDAEAEFVSLDGELKECVLWFAALATARRRATLLPGGATLTADGPSPALPCGPPLGWVYDPDPAVVRAGLVTDLGQRLQARQLDPHIAYLSADRFIETPFARAFAVLVSMPFHLRRLRECLRQRGIGRVQVSRRGSAVDPEQLRRQLRLDGDGRATVLLTRVEGRPWAVVVA